MKTDPNATTNKIACLRTEIAEKERRIAQLTNDNEKLNKQKMQSTTLLNGLQRENSAKDALVHQSKNEIEKLKKELREKDSTISTMSAKVSRLYMFLRRILLHYEYRTNLFICFWSKKGITGRKVNCRGLWGLWGHGLFPYID